MNTKLIYKSMRLKGATLFFVSIIFSLVLSTTANASATAFYDLYSGNPNYSAIEYFRLKNVAFGYADGSFRPGFNAQRGDFIAMVVRASGGMNNSYANNNYYNDDYTDEDYAGCFTDVRGKSYEYAVCYAKAQGWLDGFDAGFSNRKFRPKAKVSYSEASKIVAKAFGLKNVYGSDALNAPITRGEATQLIYNVMKDAVRVGIFSENVYAYNYGSTYVVPYPTTYTTPTNQYGSAYYPYNNYQFQYGAASILDSGNVSVPAGYPSPWK